jgi:FkbM family methyltransferase
MLLEVWHHEVYRIAEFVGAGTRGAVVDAGANIGLFSVAVARRDPARRVVAFEPFAENFALLEQNLAAVGARSVTAVHGALSGTAGMATLVDGGSRSQDHRLQPGAADAGVTVPTYSFADALRMTGEDSIALFKCDIEGSEYELFRAAADEDLTRVRAYAIEYHDNLRPGTLELLTLRLGPTHALDCRPAGGAAGWGMLYATSRERKP